ncbi:type VII secretion target [Nocardia niigatensis]
MQVSPEDLRKAATTIDGIADTVGKLPTVPVVSAGDLAIFLPGSETAAQYNRIEPARAKAIGIVAGRYREMAAVFRTSADTYHDTDVESAARFDAMGELNSGSMPQ